MKCIINDYSSRVCELGTKCCDVYHDEVFCPFCLEEGFDKIALKSHLFYGDCEKFNNIEILRRLF